MTAVRHSGDGAERRTPESEAGDGEDSYTDEV